MQRQSASICFGGVAKGYLVVRYFRIIFTYIVVEATQKVAGAFLLSRVVGSKDVSERHVIAKKASVHDHHELFSAFYSSRFTRNGDDVHWGKAYGW